jgi:hypothetical protein
VPVMLLMVVAQLANATGFLVEAFRRQ